MSEVQLPEPSALRAVVGLVAPGTNNKDGILNSFLLCD